MKKKNKKKNQCLTYVPFLLSHFPKNFSNEFITETCEGGKSHNIFGIRKQSSDIQMNWATLSQG